MFAVVWKTRLLGLDLNATMSKSFFLNQIFRFGKDKASFHRFAKGYNEQLVVFTSKQKIICGDTNKGDQALHLWH